MPGAPFLNVSDTYQGVQGEGIPQGVASSSTGLTTAFYVWLVILGVIVPVLILGGLRAGGFQFVFKRR
jgi:hypothetical protein